jgi:hypothetical protein
MSQQDETLAGENTILPTDTRFVLCEDVRQEENGKVTLVGVFAGDDVVLPANSTPGGALPSLAIFTIFGDGKGEFPLNATLQGPSGELSTHQYRANTLTVLEGVNSVVVYKWVPFRISEFGTYIFTIELGEGKYPYRFNVITAAPAPHAN